jgi:hypothetical protein
MMDSVSVLALDIDKDGERAFVNALMVFSTDKDSIAGRLLALLKEAEAEWRKNPTGPVQFRESMIGDTYSVAEGVLFGDDPNHP